MNDNALSLFGVPYRKLEQRQLQDFLAEPPEGGSPIPATAPDASASGSRTQTDPGGVHPSTETAASSPAAAAVPGGGDLRAAPAGSPDPADPGIGDDPAGPTFPGPMQPAGPAVPGSAVPRPAVSRPAVPRPAQDESVTVTFTFAGPDEDPTEVTVKVNRVVDRYGDPLGYLLIGSPNSPEESLQERFSLTDRETAIVSKAAKGWRNSRIAEDLGISEQTVKNHLAAVYKKLGVSNRVELLNLISVE
jgi:DNA-binding CsgD family transcriptional regulator